MNVAFVCNEYPPAPHGGIGSVVVELAPALAARGHRVRVVGVYPEEETSEGSGVSVTRLKAASLPKVSWYLDRQSLMRYLDTLSVNEGIEMVEAPDFAGWVPRGVSGASLVLRLHGPTFYFPLPMPPLQRRLVGRLERRSLAAANAWIAPSRFILDSVSAITDSRPKLCEVIPNPVDTQLFRPDASSRREGEKLVVYVGTLTPRKGVVDVARAAPHFLDKDPESRLVFIGPPEPRSGPSVLAELEDIVGTRLASRVTFTGAIPRSEVAAWLQRASIAVLPSHIENFAMTWLESMAAGCAVIGTTAAAGPEAIEHGVSGLLAEPGRPDELAQMIVHLLEDESLAGQLGEGARTRVLARYSVESVVERTEDFYRSVLRG